MIFLLLAALALLAVIAGVMIHNAIALRRLHRRLDARARLDALSRAPDDDGGSRGTAEPVLRIIKGGAMAMIGAAGATIAWTKEHPAAAVVGLVGAVATTAVVAASTPMAVPDIGNPIAGGPPPPVTVTPLPVPPPPAPPATPDPAPTTPPTATSSSESAATVAARAPAPHEHPVPGAPPYLVATRTTTAQPPHPASPGTSTPEPPGTTPAPKPPTPTPCGGIDVNLRPIADLCVL
ncbi:hypothetical protein [Amycolatopsis benzoatilytica]|uniref:hypothetical protein n=1 Tax=Amycolatopsis benzoatilytica TaxID=346045 RepID=UPI0003A718AB|nr:hypothetical protein [Amycolatopsis benzoatilytica]